MKIRLAVAALSLLAVVGCNNKSEELQKQVAQLESDRSTLQQNMAEREQFVGEVVQAVNDVYKDIEAARASEKKIVEQAGGTEGSANLVNADARKELLDNINTIGVTLKENQKRISNLQLRAKKLGADIAGLNTVIENLKVTIAEREQSIAMLEARVKGLENTVAEKTQAITDREVIIDQQQKILQTAYFIAGTRDELKQKGIIADEGGFLWGLVGSTTVLASGIDQSVFTPIDITKDQTFQVEGEIDEIIPARKGTFFATARNHDNKSELTVKDPTRFWQDRYLVVVLN